MPCIWIKKNILVWGLEEIEMWGLSSISYPFCAKYKINFIFEDCIFCLFCNVKQVKNVRFKQEKYRNATNDIQVILKKCLF
jgi:hypothetical protein